MGKRPQSFYIFHFQALLLILSKSFDVGNQLLVIPFLKTIVFSVLLLHLDWWLLLVFTADFVSVLFLNLHIHYILLVWLWLGRGLRDNWLIQIVLLILRHFLIDFVLMLLMNRHYFLRNDHFIRCLLCILRCLIDHTIILKAFLFYCVGFRPLFVLS